MLEQTLPTRTVQNEIHVPHGARLKKEHSKQEGREIKRRRIGRPSLRHCLYVNTSTLLGLPSQRARPRGRSDLSSRFVLKVSPQANAVGEAGRPLHGRPDLKKFWPRTPSDSPRT